MTHEDKGVWTLDGWRSTEEYNKEAVKKWGQHMREREESRRRFAAMVDVFLAMNTPTRWQRFREWLRRVLP